MTRNEAIEKALDMAKKTNEIALVVYNEGYEVYLYTDNEMDYLLDCVVYHVYPNAQIME